MQVTQHDPLIEYMKRYAGAVRVVPPSVFAGVSFVGDFAQIVLHRDGEFQTQLCLCKPNAEIPDHGHPNVESILVYVTGEIDLRIDGKRIYEPGRIYEAEDGRCSQNEHWMRIGPGQLHGATIGPAGGAFMTFQRWIGCAPKTVENDWEGPALSEAHAESLKR